MENSAPKDPAAPVVEPTSTSNLTPQTPSVSPSAATPGVSTPPVLNTQPVSTPAAESIPTVPKKSSKLLIVVLCALVILVIIVGAVYFIMLQQGRKTATNNAQNQAAAPIPSTPIKSGPTATPTPDTSNTGLEQDNNALNQDLNSLDTTAAQINTDITTQTTP